MCQGTRRISQIEEWSERSRGKEIEKTEDEAAAKEEEEEEEALVFQETRLCQSIPGWQGSGENRPPKHIAAQQAVTCACTTIYTVIRT